MAANALPRSIGTGCYPPASPYPQHREQRKGEFLTLPFNSSSIHSRCGSCPENATIPVVTANPWLVSANSSGGTTVGHTGHETVPHWEEQHAVASTPQCHGCSDPDTQPERPGCAGKSPGSLGLSRDVHCSTFLQGGFYFFVYLQSHEVAQGAQRSLPGPGCEIFFHLCWALGRSHVKSCVQFWGPHYKKTLEVLERAERREQSW